jgi:hypothetical protein
LRLYKFEVAEKRHIWLIPLSRVALQEQDIFSTLYECRGALTVITIVCSLPFQVIGFNSPSLLSHCFVALGSFRALAVYEEGRKAGHIAFAYRSLHQGTFEVAGKNHIWFISLLQVALKRNIFFLFVHFLSK